MTAQAHVRDPVRIPAYVVTLLATAMFINYVDRGSLSIVAPVLKREFELSNKETGLLLSSFFWTYALAQPLSGWIAQRFSPRVVLAAAAAIWAFTTAGSGFANGVIVLMLLRLILGLAESTIFPTTAAIFAAHAPEDQRGRCNAAMSVGTALGPSAGTLIAAVILITCGWRAVFFALGALSALWLIPWLASSDRSLAASPASVTEPASYSEILRQRSLWGACIAQLCWAYPFYLVLTWFPLYLVGSEGLSLSQMAWITAALYGLQALGAVASGWASDRLIAKGNCPSYIRKLFVIGGMGGTCLLFGLAALTPGSWSTAFVLASGFTVGVSYTMVFAIGQTLAGPRAAGRWMGLQNMAGNLSGIAAPIITGIAVDWTGSFAAAFVIAAGTSAIGALAWWFIVEQVRPIPWGETQPTLG